jgi:hypothetical protein
MAAPCLGVGPERAPPPPQRGRRPGGPPLIRLTASGGGVEGGGSEWVPRIGDGGEVPSKEGMERGF